MPKETFATRLRTLREARGWTQEDLSAAAGIRQQAVSLLELGKRQPGMKTLCKLADALQCKLDDLR